MNLDTSEGFYVNPNTTLLLDCIEQLNAHVRDIQLHSAEQVPNIIEDLQRAPIRLSLTPLELGIADLIARGLKHGLVG